MGSKLGERWRVKWVKIGLRLGIRVKGGKGRRVKAWEKGGRVKAGEREKG